MTTKQATKLTALRAEADMHGDTKTMALCDAALAGDVAAAAKLGLSIKAAKSAQAAADRKPQRQSAWAVPVRDDDASLEDMGYAPRR